jgi:hypothetical protein
MKNLILYIIIILLPFLTTQAQNNSQQLSQEQVQTVVHKMMQFYDQYDNGAPESLKKAKFNEYVDEVNPALSKADRKKAYTIVNAYIMADKGQSLNLNISDEKAAESEKMLQSATDKQQQGLEATYQKVAEIKQMSYSEYRDYVTQNGQVYMDENQIRKAYNEMHKDDGKQVSTAVIDTGDNEKLSQIKAIDVLRNPKSYKEFRQAILTLKPNMPEEEIRKAWQNKQ